MPTLTPLPHPARRTALELAAELYRYDPAAGEWARDAALDLPATSMCALEAHVRGLIADAEHERARRGPAPAWRCPDTPPTYGGGPDPDDDPPPW